MDKRPSYDEKLQEILRVSAAVFADKGYHRASIRDISAATGMSLSGLYYYFKSKEELLFLIQNHCFGTLLERLDEDLSEHEDPEAILRIFVRNHLGFFVNNMNEMKVLSHEADILTGEYREVVQEKKRRYTRMAREILAALQPDDGVDLRTATFSLFGMMNWIYTWYKNGRDQDVRGLTDVVLHIFLNGFRTSQGREGVGVPQAPAKDVPSIWSTP